MADTNITAFNRDGEIVVDSRLIAERLGIDHSNFLETIEKHRTIATQTFGIFRFETEKLNGPGRRPKYCLLNDCMWRKDRVSSTYPQSAYKSNSALVICLIKRNSQQ